MLAYLGARPLAAGFLTADYKAREIKIKGTTNRTTGKHVTQAVSYTHLTLPTILLV